MATNTVEYHISHDSPRRLDAILAPVEFAPVESPPVLPLEPLPELPPDEPPPLTALLDGFPLAALALVSSGSVDSVVLEVEVVGLDVGGVDVIESVGEGPGSAASGGVGLGKLTEKAEKLWDAMEEAVASTEKMVVVVISVEVVVV